MSYIASGNKYSEKCKAHLNKNRARGLISRKAPHGTWKCTGCDLIFDIRHELRTHYESCHGAKSIKVIDGVYECPFCYKRFARQVSAMAHMTNCPNHPNKAAHDLAAKARGKAYSDKIKSGQIVNGFKGKHYSAAARERMRIAACKYLATINPTPCRYNKSSIAILEAIAQERGWHIQHAENGGEFYTGIGYWLDAYDKQLNIALEYDEPEHYVDAQNNILREKDLERQRNIIEHLHCEYYRFNEATKKLWKVEL